MIPIELVQDYLNEHGIPTELTPTAVLYIADKKYLLVTDPDNLEKIAVWVTPDLNVKMRKFYKKPTYRINLTEPDSFNKIIKAVNELRESKLMTENLSQLDDFMPEIDL